MQIPSVSGMFQARVGPAMGRMPVGRQSSGTEFTALFANAVSGTASQQDPAAQELTVVDAQGNVIDASAAPISFGTSTLFGAGAAAVSKLLPLFIPASSLVQAYAPGNSPSALGRQVVEFAKQFVGTPYVAGGEDLVKGADCSGFVQSVYARFGVELPRSSNRQSHVGTQVDPQNLQPGDLLFFKTADYAPVTHVAMYVGDGKIIHASSKKTGVIVSNLRLKDDFVIARRLL